jgi:hypothetical protein
MILNEPKTSLMVLKESEMIQNGKEQPLNGSEWSHNDPILSKMVQNSLKWSLKDLKRSVVVQNGPKMV